jgi:hypothetical protein
MWSTTKWFRFIPEAGEFRREVYGRSSDKTSRAETPINTGISKGDGRSDAFLAYTVSIRTS